MIKKLAPHIHEQLKLNLKKIQGMLKKIDMMLEDDDYCPGIAQQINATIGLLKSMNRNLLKLHLKARGVPTILTADTEKIDAFIDEFLKIVDVTTHR
jgi:DNA-binding FrmR family transcriptional regulator